MNIKYIAATLTFSLTFVFCMAQVSSPEESFKDTADYNIFNGPDSIFVFYNENAPVTIEGDGPGDDWYRYEWWKYEPGTGYVFIDSDSVEVSSVDTITVSSGYMLVTRGESYSDTSRCWILINDYSVEIPRLGLVSCGLISDFRAEIDSARLYYYQPEKDSLIQYPVRYSYIWTNDQGDDAAKPKTSGVLQAYVDEPYYEDTYYIIEVTDFSGLERSDSVFYESVEPHAEFSADHEPITNTDLYPEYAPIYENEYDPYTSKSAPGFYSFDNLSVNADVFEWDFGDGETAVSNSISDTVVHNYFLTGSYTVTLVAKKEYLLDYCTDTFRIDREESGAVTFEESKIEQIANYFVPGDGNVYRFKDISITYFQIAIYNRYGKPVHKYEGDIREWEGWDGTYLHNDNYVPNGVYYYVVKRIDALPDWETGIIPDLTKSNDNSNSGTSGTDQQTNSNGANNVYRGFIHVFNRE